MNLKKLTLKFDFLKKKKNIVYIDGKAGKTKTSEDDGIFYVTYAFKGLIAFYAAWLSEIEFGKKSWADDSQILESASSFFV